MPGPQELLVIAVLALLVFGPDRLPELARTAGRLLTRVRSETQRNVQELKRLSEIQQLQAELKDLKRELDDTRHEVRDGVREVTGLSGGRRSTTRGAERSGGGAGPAGWRAEDDPPPFDPEAT